jgi:mono/diheme cytochrome c family protein
MKFKALARTGPAPLLIGLCLALGVLLAFAQPQDVAVRKVHESDYVALANVPVKARAQRNPFEGDAEAVAAGRKLFEQHCAQCHGQDAGGGKRGPSLRVVEVQKATPGALFFILTNGVIRRGMPDWSKLPEPERWQLVTFLRTLRGTSGSSRRP